MVQRLIFVTVFSFVSFGTGFLLEENTPSPNAGLTDKHYIAVVDLLLEERKLRQQLEVAVTQMHKDFEAQFSELRTNNCSSICVSMQTSQQSNNHKVDENIKNLQQQVLALQNDDGSYQRRIADLQKEVQLLVQNQTVISAKLSGHNQQLSFSQKPVGFTACSGVQTVSSNSIVTFPVMKTRYGISAFTSTGIFTCEATGLYLISTTITSSLSNSYFKVFKNSTEIVEGYITANTSGYYESGTAVVVTQMYAGETIYVKAGSTLNILGLLILKKNYSNGGMGHMVRLKKWGPSGDLPCAGIKPHGICIIGVADLQSLVKRPEMFVNKLFWDYEHYALDCLEEFIHNRTVDGYHGNTDFDSDWYSSILYAGQ